MSTPPPGWQGDTGPSPQVLPAELVGAPVIAVSPFASPDAPASATAVNQFASAPNPTLGMAKQRTLSQRNSASFTAICVAGLYLILAATTGIVLIGIFPGMLAVRAFQRREPLAPLAGAAAAVAIVFALTVLTRH